MMMDVDGAGSHSDFIPRITIVLTTVSFSWRGISAGAFKPALTSICGSLSRPPLSSPVAGEDEGGGKSKIRRNS
jgi:hypothetical protein